MSDSIAVSAEYREPLDSIKQTTATGQRHAATWDFYAKRAVAEGWSRAALQTMIVVVGDLNPAVLTPGATTSGKAARAFALQGKGQGIEVVIEDDFIRSLERVPDLSMREPCGP